MVLQTFLLKPIRLLTYKHLLDSLKPHMKNSVNARCIYKRVLTISLPVIIVLLSFSTAGCATLEALEPTAALINDLKKIL